MPPHVIKLLVQSLSMLRRMHMLHHQLPQSNSVIVCKCKVVLGNINLPVHDCNIVVFNFMVFSILFCDKLDLCFGFSEANVMNSDRK
jgi:hypothetical protein